jgi:putative transposase
MARIELNPNRAKWVNHPGEFKWSSYQANAQGNKDSVVESHPFYSALGETVANVTKPTVSCFEVI